MKINTSKMFSVPNLMIMYWAMYWLMNGLDKFFNRQSLGLFTWHGKDRTNQFSGYFNNTEISTFWIDPLLYLVAVWELAIAIPLFLCLWKLAFRARFDIPYFKFGMACGVLTFIIFSFFDVIFGDRAELLEHGTFLILVVISYQLVLNPPLLSGPLGHSKN